MPVEPPVTTARTLAEAYALLASADADAPLRPVAGGTDLLVQITGEIGAAARGLPRPVAARRAARHRRPAGRGRPR